MDIVLIILISVVLSGFFSGAEIAFFSLTEAKVHSLEKDKTRGAALVSKLKANPERLLITILICNNAINIVSASVVTVLVAERIGSNAIGIASGVMTLMILIFGEIVPKSLSARFAVRMARISAYPLSLLQIILSPLIYILESLTKLINRIFKQKNTTAAETEAELTSLAQLGYKHGRVEELEHEVIRNVFTLNDTKVTKAMTKREDIVMVDAEKTINETIKTIKKEKYSRIPIYKNDPDSILGFVMVKDMITVPRDRWTTTTLSQIKHTVVFVRPSTVLSDLFNEFIHKHTHMAIVRNSKKQVLGLITIEDIIEEVLGEIEDETDEANGR